MASPPFSLSTSTPGDSDIVSQFPLNERTVRDIVQSWLVVNHDTNGNHNNIIMPYQSTPATPAASLLKIYATATGRLQVLFPDGHVEPIGVPAGAVIFAGYTPLGYLIGDGSAISRSVYADLFTVYGITFGSGDGSTTFNIPDLRGRYLAAEDNGVGNLTSTYYGVSPVLSAKGGLQNHVQTVAEMPAHSHSNTLNDPGHQHAYGLALDAPGGSAVNSARPGSAVLSAVGFTGMTINNAGTGSGNAFSIVPPTIIMRGLIKT